MKFANKITLVIIILASVVVPLVGFSVFYFSKNIVQNNIITSQRELTEHTLNSIDRILYRAFQDIERISDDQFLEKFFTLLERSGKVAMAPNTEGLIEEELKEDIKAELKEGLLLTGPWDILTVLDKTGRIIFSTQTNLVEKHVSEYLAIRTAFYMAFKGQRYYSDLIVSPETGRPTILFSSPIKRDSDNNKLGVVVGHFAWPAVLEILDELDPLNQVFLFDESGMMIATQTEHRDKILRFSLAEYDLVKKQFLKNKTSSGVLTIEEEAGPVLATVATQQGHLSFRGSHWGLFIGVPLRVALEPVNRMANNVLILIVVIMIVIAGSVYLISRRLSRPIENLIAVVEVVGEGNLDIRAEVTTKDEIGQLASSFNQMVIKRKEAEQAVQEAIQTLETRVQERTAALERITHEKELILNAAGEGIYGVDLRGNTTFLNPAAEKILGYSSEELIGKSQHEAIHHSRADGSHHPKEECHIYRAISDGQAHHVNNEVFWKKDGTAVPVEYVSTPILDEENVVGAVVTFKDISERKKAEQDLIVAKEEAERANNAKSEFLSQMSHELRTPLNAILGFGQIMESDKEKVLTEFQKRSVSEILKGGYHLLELINEILDLSRIESGHLTLSLENINLNVLTEELVTLCDPMAKKSNIELLNYVPLHDDIYVFADRVRLKQVLLNLLSNAIKYNKAGGTVKIDAVGNKEERVCISVTDTGMGIPADRLDDLFQPFNRLGSERTEIEGTGVGLTITKRLVEYMNGTIEVESRLGQGSTFLVTFPIGEKEEAVRDLPRKERVREISSTTPARERWVVLYVEDNPANLNLVRHIFRRRPDVLLLTAPEAKLGIELAEAHRPDLILLDINLPGMDGLTAFKLLKAMEETRNTPVVAISANAMPRDIKNALETGFSDYLTKPLDVPEFNRVVEEQLKISQQRK